MPERFEPLGIYNAEKARGIVHTAEWDQHMAVLQEGFNDWWLTQAEADGWQVEVLAGGATGIILRPK